MTPEITLQCCGRTNLKSISETAATTEPSHAEELVLIGRAKSGDQAACSRLVGLFRSRMMSIAGRYMRCESDCNDAVQDAFISAFRSLDRFEGQSRLSTWLQRITVNACLMKLRQGTSRRETSIEQLLSAPTLPGGWTGPRAMEDPSAAVEADETRVAVRQAIDRLPEAFRRVLLLRDIDEMDNAAAAALLQTSRTRVRVRLQRARQALCAALGSV